jgi:SSS family transporter
MTDGLSPWDVAVVALYIGGTTLLGVWFARKQRDLRTYFVGDRDVSWWLVLVSIVATETSTVTFLSVPGLAFRPGGDYTFLQLAFGYLIGRAVVAWLLLPQYLRGELYSAYELLRTRFSPAVQRTASALFLATRTVADGLRLFLTGLLLQQFTGWDIETSILVMGLTTIAYTFLGGMQAVIWTDLIQFVIYIAGAVVAGLLLVDRLPGGWEDLTAAGREAGKFRLYDLSGDPTKPYTLWAGLLGGAVFTMASHGADQLMVQRYLCSRSLGQARLALVLSGVVVLLQFALFLTIGVGLAALHRYGLLPLPPGTRNDEVFGTFIVRYLPTGLVGLVVAAVLAAAMSTLSSSLNSSANAFMTDFYRPLRRGGDLRRDLLVSRGMTLVWGVAQMAVALAALRVATERSLIDQVLSVAGFTTGMVLGLFLLGSLRRPVGSRAALVGLVVGLLAVLAVYFSPQWSRVVWPDPPAAGDAASGGGLVRVLHAGLAWPWFAPIGTCVTVAVALLVNRFGTTHGSPGDGKS